MKKDLKDIFKEYKELMGKEVVVQGWIRNHRKQKELGFIDFFDGTYFTSVQLVYDNKLEMFDDIQKLHVGCAITVTGTLVKSERPEQLFEIMVKNVVLEGDCPEDYPIQPKRHTREFLREQAYLRPRTNLFQATFKVRSIAAHAIHTYFQDRGYTYFHAPIITGSDCEGAGEMFQVTTLDLEKGVKEEDYKDDFFGKKAGLTVSGQLQAEPFALAFKRVYTFGPTFRAENSNTKKHASEFWMIEPEMAFMDLDDLMNVEEDMLKYIINYVMTHAKAEIEFLDKFVENGLIAKLQGFVDSKAVRIDHKEAIQILKDADVEFENKPEFGEDLATEHEKYLTEVKFKSPVFVKNWPKDIKAFYMRLNEDNETVAAVDFLVPGCGELMGGSQREERYDVLLEKIHKFNLKPEDYSWYLDLRRYGSVVHSGFGLGFDRILMYITGISNIRDAQFCPRTPKNCNF
jgi:asparaginyl-tRNA synthetase